MVPVNESVDFGRKNATAIAASGATVVKGISDIVWGYVNFTTRTFDAARNNMQMYKTCRTPADLVHVNGVVAREAYGEIVGYNERLVNVTQKLFKKALDPITGRCEKIIRENRVC